MRIYDKLASSSPYLQRVAEELADSKAWVVGGSIRDALLYGSVKDLDLVVEGDPSGPARQLACKLDADVFELSERFPAWRVLLADGNQVDIASCRGTVEEDLALRDFTVNAVAVPLAGGEPIDPTGGLGDLDRGLLKMVSEEAFIDDPLRVLRLARLIGQHGLTVDDATVKSARAYACELAKTPGERSFTELALMLNSGAVLTAFDIFDSSGALAVVLPELEALKGVEQTAYHYLDAYGHTVEVLEKTVEIQSNPAIMGPEHAAVEAHLKRDVGNLLSAAEAMRFAALFHDLGKSKTRSVSEDGRVTFIGHDRVGMEMTRAICKRLRTSRAFSSYVSNLTLNHLHLGFLVHNQPFDRRTLYHYLKKCDPYPVAVTVLTMADRLATHGGKTKQEAIDNHLALAREVLVDAMAWEDNPPASPVGGRELANALQLEEGPVIGELIAAIKEEAFAGAVKNADDAITFARKSPLVKQN